MFLFEMTTGKRKLGYGVTAEDAIERLALRLTKAEMKLVRADQYITLAHQRDLPAHVGELG